MKRVLILKRMLFIVVFLIVWVGSIFLYAFGASGTANESVYAAISIFWVVVFAILARKVFREQAADPDTAAAVGIAQIVGTDGFDDMDFDV